MIIVMCATRNWYFYMSVALYSILRHNKVKKIYLFIEDDKIPYIKDTRVEFININKIPQYVKKTSPNYDTKYSKLSYTRCFFSKILQESKILYLDVDALVINNIEELWNVDIKEKALAGVYENGEWSKYLGIDGLDYNYINSGVLVMNLDYIRQHKLDDKMIDLLNTKHFYFPDQDVLNIVCKNHIEHIDNKYNSAETTGINPNAKIIHYIRERKGWIRESPRSEIWLEVYNEYIKEILNGGGNMIKLQAEKEFNLGKFNELKNLVRADIDKNEEGKLYKDDTFECTEEMARYLTGENDLKIAVVKVIEIIPEEKPVKKTTAKKTTTKKTTTKKAKKE